MLFQNIYRPPWLTRCLLACCGRAATYSGCLILYIDTRIALATAQAAWGHLRGLRKFTGLLLASAILNSKPSS